MKDDCLNLSSVGLMLHDGFKVSEVQPDGTFSGKGLRSREERTPNKEPEGLRSALTPRRPGHRGKNSDNRTTSNNAAEDYISLQGVPHTSTLVRVVKEFSFYPEDAADDSGNLPLPQAAVAGGVADVNLVDLAEEYAIHMESTTKALLQHLKRLPAGSKILEVGSRLGKITIQLSKELPDLWIQPTEGTGRTTPGLLLLLQENLDLYQQERMKQAEPLRRGSSVGAAANPRRMSGPVGVAKKTLKNSWSQQVGLKDFACIFAVDVLHFIGLRGVEAFLKGAERSLQPGGIVLLCGRFIGGKQAGESNLVYDSALQNFAKSEDHKSVDVAGRDLRWGLLDIQDVLRLATKAGLEFVKQEDIRSSADADNYLIVLQRIGHRGHMSSS
eukprot:TRINITY_DN9355_c0_g1_i2.p1 TRINITY_DN9355_c0_g1~~TRINITY_DN9355_c0_g1_i2.p1  ORF type:complete len:385 (+),score=72.99 TRINITY_DN9355_c0_g1_i2:78-1232(+)